MPVIDYSILFPVVSCPAKDALLTLSTDYLMKLGCYGNTDWKEDTRGYNEGWIDDPGNHTWKHTKDTGR